MQSFYLQRAEVLDVLGHKAFVGVSLEEVLGHLRFLTQLEMAKNHVNPLRQCHTHRVRLESHSHLEHEILGALGPVWQSDITHLITHVVLAEVCPGRVHQEGTIADVELRRQLLVVAQDVRAILPRVVNTMEDPVGRATKGVHLELDQEGGESPDQIVKDHAVCRVVAHVHVSLINRFFFVLVLTTLLTILQNDIFKEGRAAGRLADELKVLRFEFL